MPSIWSPRTTPDVATRSTLCLEKVRKNRKNRKGAVDRSYKYKTTKDKYTKTTTDIYSLKSNKDLAETPSSLSQNEKNETDNETDNETASFEKAEKEITAKTDNNPTSPPSSASPPLLPKLETSALCREFWVKVGFPSKNHDEDRRGGHKVFMRIEKPPTTDEQGKLTGTLEVLYLRRNRDTWCAVDPAKGTQRLCVDLGNMDWLRGRMKGLGGSERDLLWGILVCLHDLRNKFASGLKLDDPENYISKVISNDLTHNQLNMYLDKFTASSNSRVLNIWQHFRGLVAAQKYRPLPAVLPENTARALLELLLQYKESGVSQLHEYAVKHWKTICAKYRGGILSDIINADIIYRNAQELLIDAKSEVGKYDSWKIKS